MQQQRVIDSLAELKALAANRPKKTKTYRVTPEVAKANYDEMVSRPGYALRPMNDAQIEELARYVGIPVGEMRMAEPQIEEKHCPCCGRQLTFTDLIHEAVEGHHHDRRFMGEVLLGKIGPVITISGSEDDSHVFRCLSCGDRSVKVGHGDCYASGCGGRTYAHCAW